MNIITEPIIVKEEELNLTNQRAVYWDRLRALILSDVHIGKTAHFRRHGIPVPDHILQKDLERLKFLIEYFKVKTVYVVGDLFHAETNSNMKTFKMWLSQFKDLKMILIKGNHDRQSPHLTENLNIKVEPSLQLGPFNLLHEPVEKPSKLFTISGHTHPGVIIKGRGKQKLKLPCYQLTSHQLILPAFSLFTGLNTRTMPKDAKCFGFTETSIFKI